LIVMDLWFAALIVVPCFNKFFYCLKSKYPFPFHFIWNLFALLAANAFGLQYCFNT
jgi:hypothetical protein